MTEKQILRKRLLSLREGLPEEEVERLSAQIAERIIKHPLYQEFHNICIYQAYRNEVSCKLLMEKALKQGKHIFTPVTKKADNTIEFYQIIGDTKWKTGAYGIMEPEDTGSELLLREPALILMPGLAFDRKHHRLGYGGGCYDKYLTVRREHKTMALCYAFQIVEELPFEAHDILPDYIVTEAEVL